MASIQKKNNKYCVVYYCKDIEGKRKQKWETYDTKNEAIPLPPSRFLISALPSAFPFPNV